MPQRLQAQFGPGGGGGSGIRAWLERPAVTPALIAVGLALTLLAVLRDGGTPSAYAHVAYLAIIVAAYRYRGVGGLLCGIASGAVVGPVATLILHGPAGFPAAQALSWSVRAGLMAVVGLTLGLLFSFTGRQAAALGWYQYMDRGTNLPNLAGLGRALRERADVAAEGVEPPVLAVKVTDFDQLVVTFGYEGADRVLAELAQRICDGVDDPGVIVGRTGTDELTVLQSTPGTVDADDLVRRIRRLTEASLEVGEAQVYVDTVVGVSRAPAGELPGQTTFVQAGAAAARARDRHWQFAYYDAGHESARRETLRLLGEVPGALQRGDIRLFYQPKLCLRTGRFCGVEALARWYHPGRGWIPPGVFIPVVEKTGIIESLTDVLLARAMEQARAWYRLGLAPSVAVNISTRNLGGDWLLDRLAGVLEDGCLPAECIELEVTETALIDVQDGQLDQLARLRERGVRIAIDDFGTGYASLAYIRDLPLDTLKLDRTFIRAAPAERRERKILQRMIQMAKDLDLQVVGEGVEDEETLGLLMDLGSDQAQGYYLGMPAPADDVTPVLDTTWAPFEQLRAARGQPS